VTAVARMLSGSLGTFSASPAFMPGTVQDAIGLPPLRDKGCVLPR
jgi:hypothetical protein